MFRKWRDKLTYYKFYKKVITENELELSSKFRLRRDRANRLYTVYNYESKDIEAYGSQLASIPVTNYIAEVDTYLNEKGLTELVSIKRMEQIYKDETVQNYLIVFQFALFDPAKHELNKFLFVSASVIGIILTSLYFIIK
jgi:hypothetical protein